MPKPNSTDASGQNRAHDTPASEVPPMAISANEELSTADVQTPPSNQNSIWGKAKKSLGDVSSQASSAGGSLVSKAVALGSSSAAKSADIGKQTYLAAGGATREVLEAGKQAYAGSKLESAVKYIDGELDQRGAKQAFRETAETVVGKLDQVTGKRLLELLETKLQLQDTYNDVLATRLAEALERIATLEARLAELAACAPASAPSSLPRPGAGRSKP